MPEPSPKVTDYLENYFVVNSPVDSDDPTKLDPPEPIPADQQFSRDGARAAMATLHRLYYDPIQIPGSQGELYGGASMALWEVYEAGSGWIKIRLPETSPGVRPDPRGPYGPGGIGPPQPPDKVRPLPPSAAAPKIEATLLQCQEYIPAEKGLKFSVDISMHLAIFRKSTATAPYTLPYAEVEIWRPLLGAGQLIDEAGEMGRDCVRVTRIPAPSNPEKTIVLGDFPIVYPRAAGDPVGESFKAEGWNGSAWVNLTADFIAGPTTTRIVTQVLSVEPETYSTVLYLGSTGFEGRSHPADLTALYSLYNFRFDRLTPSGSGYCGATCLYAILNPTDSKWGAPNGALPEAGGYKARQCAVRASNQPWLTGPNHYFSKRCMNSGSCPNHTPVEGSGVANEPFSFKLTWGRWLRKCLGGSGHRVDTAVGGSQSISMVEFPGAAYLAGWGLGLSTWSEGGGFHTNSAFIGEAMYGTAAIDTDGSGNKSLRLITGGFLNSLGTAGRFHASTALDDQKDPVTNGALGDPRDPTTDKRKHFPRMGVLVQRDSGNWAGRGVHEYTKSILDADIELEDIRITIPGIKGHGRVKYEVYESTYEHPTGLVCSGHLQIEKLINCDKPETFEGTGTVKTITPVGDGLRWAIEFANVTHNVQIGVGGGADLTGSFLAGGNPDLCMPPQYRRVLGHYSGGKYVGDGTARFSAGDGCRFESTIGGVDLSPYRFLVDSVEPHGGVEGSEGWSCSYASTPGNGLNQLNNFESYGLKQDKATIYEESGIINFLGTAAFVGALFRAVFNACVFVPKLVYTLQAKVSGTWTTVPTEHRIFEHGRGRVYVSAAFTSAHTGNITGWRVTE